MLEKVPDITAAEITAQDLHKMGSTIMELGEEPLPEDLKAVNGCW